MRVSIYSDDGNDCVLTEEDARIIYDNGTSIGDMLMEQFLDRSKVITAQEEAEYKRLDQLRIDAKVAFERYIHNMGTENPQDEI